MPPKDDDDPASAKEVVTKKQKQLLNREELDLNLIAESLGGVLLEAPATSGRGSGFNLGSILSRLFGGRGGARNPIKKKYSSGGSGGSGDSGGTRVTTGQGGRPSSVSRGTPVGGYGTQPSTPPANAALQPQVDPRALDKYRIKQNYVNPKVKPVSRSGGDAGAAARQRILQRSNPLRGVRGGIRGGLANTVVNMAVGGALDKYVVEPVGKAGSDALVRGVLALQGQTARGRNRVPSIYGLAGPDVTPQQVEREKELAKLKPKKVKLPSYEEDPSRTAPVGAFNVSPPGSASRKKVETAIAKANAARQAQSQAQAQRLKVEPFKDTKVTTKDPDTTPQPNQKIDPALVGAGSQVASRFTRRGDTKKRDDKKPKFGVPSQARGKIGRRQNPQ